MDEGLVDDRQHLLGIALVAGSNRVPTRRQGKPPSDRFVHKTPRSGAPRKIRAIHVPRDLAYRQAERSV